MSCGIDLCCELVTAVQQSVQCAPSLKKLTSQLPLVISCLQVLHSVNRILFTLLLVYLILRISPHHNHHLRSHHLSLPRPFNPDIKLISVTNPFLHSLHGSFWTAFTDLEPVLDEVGTNV